jgi:mono/diheme cytochrome c family protein
VSRGAVAGLACAVLLGGAGPGFTACAALAASPAPSAARFDLPEGPGRDFIYGYCQTCHDLQSVVDSAGIRRGAWDAVLDNMREFGLRVDADRRAKILNYLATYLGPNPPPQQKATEATEAGTADGAQVFGDTCIACHEADGKGKPEEFPPLAGNSDLFLAADFVPTVVLNGIEGPIEVEGAAFHNVMPPFDFLSDEEIAAVVAYVRSEWGNDAIRPADFPDVTAADVAAQRDKPMTPAEVHAYRESLK